MARLLNVSIEQVQSDRLAHAREFAAARRVHVVLKGHRTIIAGPEGRSFVNLTGNAGMATGGTGDLLTGMIAAWFAQILDPEGACKLAVYLHGTAGDLAEADEGEVALLPSDIAERLGDAVLELTAREGSSARAVTEAGGPVGPTFRSGVIETASEAETAQRGEGSGAHASPRRRRAPLRRSRGGEDRVRARHGARHRRQSRRTSPARPSPSSRNTPARRATLYHVDLYRLEPAEIDDLGLDDLVSGDGIVAIEWAERWTGRPDDVTEVRIEDMGDDRRRIRIDA